MPSEIGNLIYRVAYNDNHVYMSKQVVKVDV